MGSESVVPFSESQRLDGKETFTFLLFKSKMFAKSNFIRVILAKL